MNQKTAIGLVVAIIIIGIAIFALQKKDTQPIEIPLGDTPAETGTTTDQTQASASTSAAGGRPPAIVEQTGMVQSKAPRITAYDDASLKTGSQKPVITGTANISMVGIVVEDPNGIGIAGSHQIPVVDGHWSFAVPQRLKPGTYLVYLIGGDDVMVTSMKVQ